jgi:hypothetical protein
LPLLHPEPEQVAGLALATKAFEAAGLLAALSSLQRRQMALRLIDPKGTPT